MLGPKLGLGPNSRQSYINLDMGDRQPNETEAAVLAEWLGSYPVEEPAEEIPSQADLATAINRLTEELAAMRAERAAFQKGIVGVLRLYGAGQVPQELLDALVPQPLEGARQ